MLQKPVCLSFHPQPNSSVLKHTSGVSTFFGLGQVLPTHRKLHSQFAGLFQPTIAQTIRLLSRGPYTTPTPAHPAWSANIDTARSLDLPDPFSNPTWTYSTTGTDTFSAPSAYTGRKHSWVHIFPEGKVHQRNDRNMRYFKWGVARLILESEPCPQVVPLWIEGFDEILHEARTEPRWWPRWGKKVSITFGEPVSETVWRGFREQWKRLKEMKMPGDNEADIGRLNDELMTGKEAELLRMEVTRTVREQILRLRRSRGWPDEDPKAGLWETYLEEGGKYEGQMQDGSWVKDM
jgi:monolysocardiolipin acyltransferase